MAVLWTDEARFATRAVHAGLEPDPTYGSVVPPIHQTSTFGQSEPGVNKGYCYSRTGNPTRSALEENLAALEGARYGVAFASGMAAIHGVLSLLRSGDHVVQGGCRLLWGRGLLKMGRRPSCAIGASSQFGMPDPRSLRRDRYQSVTG